MKTDALQGIAQLLIQWFDANRRALPWRRDREPYHVWVSEIMLQQTRVEAVMRCYERFMRALPDVQSLAAVEDDVLLKLWEGLGYYSRARNLKKAAQMIVTEYGGVFPQTYEQLRKLPGIGEYTAGAIASICYNEKVPAVDGNVLRILARLTGSRDNVLLPEVKKAYTAELRKLLPDEAGSFNEGLMELGELVCVPNGAPGCARCPLAGFCVACRDDLTAQLPVRVKQTKRRREDKSVFVLRAPDGRIAVEKRPARGLLSGMYQLPNIDGFHDDAALLQALEDRGLQPTQLRFLKDAKHIFTHIDWYMKGYHVSVTRPAGGFLWVTEEELEASCPLPTVFRKILS